MVMTASAECPHLDIGVFTQPVKTANGRIILLLQGMSCNCCGQKFSFVGLEVTAAASDSEPTMSHNGNAVSLPVIEAA